MAATTNLLTVEEFRKLPEDDGPVYHELRHGEVAAVVRPKLKHSLLQGHTRDLLRPLAPPGSLVEIEVAFRALPEHELRVADFAYVSPERMAESDPEDNIHGAPDIVIEVLSPSNTAAEMYEREQLCLENGCKEFWVRDLKRCTVRVATAASPPRIYRLGDQVPRRLFGNATLAVDTIFNYQSR